MRKSKQYKGSKVIAEYTSSNIRGASYDIETKELTITFASGVSYLYENVPHEVFSAFDNAESQGKHFNVNINKKYNHKKVVL